jgi:hypothetical protein
LHTDHRMNFMPGQRSGKLLGHVFVEQNFQGCA